MQEFFFAIQEKQLHSQGRHPMIVKLITQFIEYFFTAWWVHCPKIWDMGLLNSDLRA